MFFTAMFFLSYQKFLAAGTVINTILLGVITALMLYSKYHAVLIVLFTLLSNLSLLKRWPVYLAGLVALLLYVPHLFWQYQHNWMSFRYHLFESNVNPYKPSYTTEYILGQLLIAGPVAGFIFWRALIRYAPKTATERALKFTGLGIFIFFLISSFRGRVEANWTAPAIIPIMVLSHQYLQNHSGWRKWTYRLLPLTFLLVLFVRIIIVVDLLPVRAVYERFHQYETWPQQLKERTAGLPIIFNSSYQKASKYWFYSGQPSLSLNDYKRRRNNYNFWPLEDQVFGRPVYIIDPEVSSLQTDSLQTPIGNLHYARDTAFHSFGSIIFVPEKASYEIEERKGFMLKASFKPGHYGSFRAANSTGAFKVKLGIYDKQKWIQDVDPGLSLQQLFSRQTVEIPLDLTLQKGTFYLRFAIESDAGWFTHNSDKIKLVIK
jgi:hypothetical protein